jgi:hypothetical protein
MTTADFTPQPQPVPVQYVMVAAPAPVAGPRNGLGTTGMILGIVTYPASLIPFFGVILATLAIIFGAIGASRVRKGTATNVGAARAGLILGIVYWVLTLAFAVYVFAATSASSGLSA